MAIPDFQTIMRPVLAMLDDGETRRTRDIKAMIAGQFHLSDSERAELLPSGRQRVIDNRVGWATTYLVQAGLLERPRRAEVQITDSGREALSKHPERVDMKVLRDYPSYRAFMGRTREKDSQSSTMDSDDSRVDVSPQDLISKARADNLALVEGELLTRALSSSPLQFELLVIRLLEAMGYGRLGQVEHSGRSGDGGIDGIISQDPLGLDRIYVQAKRFGSDQTVTRPTIQGFVGALMGAQGDRGVFLTTASFTRGAIDEAERVNARIELIDGDRLAGLMVRYGVGVQPESTVTLYEIDEDFFENL